MLPNETMSYILDRILIWYFEQIVKYQFELFSIKVDIIEMEGYSDGGIVVEDCLRLMLNLLRNNSSNQVYQQTLK